MEAIPARLICGEIPDMEKRMITCPANTRLQDYLLSQNIYIKTACAGRGNCGKCRVRIVDGNAAINAMDRIWFTEDQLADGYRLGCQVYAKEQLIVDLLGEER